GFAPAFERKLDTAPPTPPMIRPICPVALYRTTAPSATTARASTARPMNGMPAPRATGLCWATRYGDGRGRSFWGVERTEDGGRGRTWEPRRARRSLMRVPLSHVVPRCPRATRPVRAGSTPVHRCRTAPRYVGWGRCVVL